MTWTHVTTVWYKPHKYSNYFFMYHALASWANVINFFQIFQKIMFHYKCKTYEAATWTIHQKKWNGMEYFDQRNVIYDFYVNSYMFIYLLFFLWTLLNDDRIGSKSEIFCYHVRGISCKRTISTIFYNHNFTHRNFLCMECKYLFIWKFNIPRIFSMYVSIDDRLIRISYMYLEQRLHFRIKLFRERILIRLRAFFTGLFHYKFCWRQSAELYIQQNLTHYYTFLFFSLIIRFEWFPAISF